MAPVVPARPAVAKPKLGYEEYIKQAAAAYARSSGLWAIVNRVIYTTLVSAKSRGLPLSAVPALLIGKLGKPRKDDPMAHSNVRAAAKAIKAGRPLCPL